MMIYLESSKVKYTCIVQNHNIALKGFSIFTTYDTFFP